ncbi:MAG: flagellar basal body L-ring protein FlgH [Alphaproteobacteria bacterium]|nr:MAG: flagellar basal body L-ring protein FlgH [Alphaproteobacteria bacterium]
MRKIILIVACGLALGGCAQYRDMRNPQTSQLVLDATSVPEVNRISVPMPTQPRKVAFKRAEASSLWHGDTRSFFGDQRAQDVGDILTVLIDIKDQAQLKNASERKRSGTQQVADPKILGYGSKIANVLPGVSQSDLPSGGNIIDLGSTSGSSGEGSIKRNETIQLKVAATIIRKLPNNNFVIAGRQEVKVNSELRELRVAGIVRPVDISRDNTVSYDKIAEARITYGGRGQISAVQKPRYGQDVMEIVLPY